jgi:hydrogenase expression/formation protein HypD
MVSSMGFESLLENPEVASKIITEIALLAGKLDRPMKIMEVCGTHTQVIARFGLRKLLPENVRLISGPGCPVCVTPSSYIEHAISLARLGFIISTFGDLLKVPSQGNSLEKEMAVGAKVAVVYSPMDALKIAVENKDKTVIFLAVGFETTIPSICATLLEAKNRNIANFKILCVHKIIPPPLRILASDPALKIDGFICPGNVSVIIGSKIYDFLPDEFKRGAVVSGFAPVDILSSVKELLDQKVKNEPKNVNNYKSVVKEEGNTVALNLIDKFFEIEDTEWRGFGVIPLSGLKLKGEWKEFDAGLIDVEFEKPEEPKGCLCGEVLKGIVSPKDCPLMGKLCTPTNPVGACMVSSEGSCAAYYRFERGQNG